VFGRGAWARYWRLVVVLVLRVFLWAALELVVAADGGETHSLALKDYEPQTG